MVDYLDDLELRNNVETIEDELKRLEHLILVSLKYTRTVDMLKEVINKLINIYDLIILVLLEYLLKNKKIDEMPSFVKKKYGLVKEHIDLPKTIENIDLYVKLRECLKKDYESTNEYRRYVNMKTKIGGEEFNVDIDAVTEYNQEINEFFKEVKELVRE